MAAQVIGIVKSAQGVVDVRSADGKIRSLLVGDSLREGDTVLTTGGGRVVIALSEGGELVLGPGKVVAMTAELSADGYPGADESQVASVDSILAALQEGRDLSTVLEATAAGPAGGPGANEGHTFVQLLRVVENVGEVGSVTTAGFEGRAPDIEPVYLIPEEGNSPPSVVIGPGDTDDLADEAGLPGGTGDDPTSVNAGGQFQVSDPDGLQDIETITIGYTNAEGEPASITIPIGDLPGTVIQTNAGQLTITSYNPQTGVAVYEYVLTNPTTDGPGPETDDFVVTVSDGEASSDPAVISIEIIDDVPVANPDTNSVANGAVNGNVSPNDVLGADGGSIVGVATGSNTSNPVTGNIGSQIAGTYGTLTLNSDGSYSYALTPNNPVIGALDDGESVVDNFVYTVRDGDGDTSTTTLKITINGSNDGPTITTDSGNPQGGNDAVLESGLASGSNPNVADTQATGTFRLTDGDGLDDIKTVTINGQEIPIGSLLGSEVPGTNGTLKITGYNAQTGEGTYIYTLTSATTDGDGAETDTFTLTTSDGTVSSAPAQIVVEIVDDTPTANADGPYGVVEDGTSLVSGNVLDNDASGADTSASFVGWSAGDAATIAALNTYGTLTQNGDGTWSYVLDNSRPATQALTAADQLSFTLNYTMQDADGDPSSSTLTLTITGANDGVTVTGIGNTAGDETVFENDLPNGSSPNDAALTQTGSFAITALDGIGSVKVGDTTISVAELAALGTTPVTIETPYGALTLTGYTGNAQGGTVSYRYTLDTTVDNDSQGGATGTNYVESLAVTVTDTDGSVGNSTLNIAIVDDVPTARDDVDSVTEDGAVVADGNVVTGSGGSDANGTDGVADTIGADGLGSVVWTGAQVVDDATLIVGQHGILYVQADGSYRYELNNADPTVQALGPDDSLTEEFAYTLTDGDGDPKPATLTISIKGADDGVTVTGIGNTAGDETVYENDLPAGSSPNDAGLTQTGTFGITALDGIGSVQVGGTTISFAELADLGTAPVTIDTPYGALTLTGYTGNAQGGTVSYRYTLDTTVDNDSQGGATGTNYVESLAVTVTDTDGSVGNSTLNIAIVDDVPTANADGPYGVVEDGASLVSGNVLDNDESGADTSASFVGWSAGDAATIAQLNQYGTLTQNDDGTWSYQLNNALAATQALTAADQLSFTLNYTMEDADGDPSSSTITITITGANDGATVTTQVGGTAPDGTVYESGLNPDGSNAGADTETTTGTFMVSATDGIGSVVIGGTSFTFAEVQAFDGTQTVNTGQGTLTLTGYTGDANSGTISYSYELDATIDNDSASPTGNDVNTLTHFDDSVLLTVNGTGGTSGSDNLVIRIVDDTPTANADGPYGVVEDGTSLVSGNVLDNDVSGADTAATFTSWSAGDAATIAALNTYGTLVQNNDGTWSYQLDNSRPATQALTAADQLSFTLNYTMQDADGDPSSSTLTITITGANDGVTVTGIGNTAGDETVYENDLPAGSSPNDAALTQTGSFGITALDGIGSVKVGDTTISYAQLAALGTTPVTIETPYGALTLTGYTGNAQGGTVSYRYTLDTTVDNDSQGGATGTNYVESLAVTVTDTDGSVGNSTLNIAIVDDTPYFSQVNNNGADNIVGLSVLNPEITTTYTGQFADWDFGADGFSSVSATGTNVEVASSSDSQIVLNLKENGVTVAQLTLNADGTDSLEVMHRDGQVVFTPIAATSAQAGGPEGSLLVDLATATDFNILVTGDDGLAPAGGANDTVNTSMQGWAVKGNSGQTNDAGESILFRFVDDGNNTTAFSVGDFKFKTQGFTGGMSTAQISVIVYLSADMTVFDVVNISATDGQSIQISQLNWTGGSGTGEYNLGDEFYGVKIVSSASNTGGFRLNGVEVGAESSTPPPDLNFNDIVVSVTDADGDVVTQAINVHIDGDTGNALTVEAITGTSGADNLVGTAGADFLIGGQGNDTLTGGGGSDTFIWRLADKGAAGAPAVDTVTDFGTGGTDVLDLRDLLQGENKADLSNLDNYLHFTSAGGNTTVHISSSGGFAGGFNAGATDQQIVLSGVTLAGGDDQAIIQNLLDQGKLLTD